MLTNTEINSFHKNGFLHLKGFFSKTYIAEIRKYILEKYIDGKSNYYVSFSDLLSDDYLNKIILDEKFINTIKSLLGDEVVYFGESCWTCSHGKTSVMTYHTDNSDRDSIGEDWKINNYPIIRFAFYLQDHSKQGGGPIVGLKTHKKFIKNMYLRVLYREILGPILGRFRYVPAEIGDLLIWNLRTTHAGDGLKFKNTNILISRRLSKYIPEILKSRCLNERFLINGNFGKKSYELDRYIKYLKTRTFQVSRWKNMKINDSIISELKNKGVEYFDIAKNIQQENINWQNLNKEHLDLSYIEAFKNNHLN